MLVSERRRSFFGWGYEENAVSADELGWFERAWSQLFHVDRFDPAPFPRESEITLRKPRLSVPASLKAFCTEENTTGCFIVTVARFTTSRG